MTISNVEMHNLVSRQLENSHIIISPGNEWFKQCVDFFISANTNCGIKELSSIVIEQLSLSDFQLIELSSLPANLIDCQKQILNGKYFLQVNTILDVGQSCYSQYNKIAKNDTSNTEIDDTKPAPWEPKSRRMLKMMCTDGQQDIIAMEYEQLFCLKEPFIPGFKIVVIGPVEYRNGILLLKSNNVNFIGGEVEHLLIKNAPLNVLCRALNQPELKNPYKFSNIKVDNTAMEVQELCDIDPPRQLENVNRTNTVPQNDRMLQSSTNQSSNNNNNNNNFDNRIGNGVITYDDFFDGADDDDDLLYLTQVVDIEIKIAQSENIVNPTPLQTLNAFQNNNKVNTPTSSVPTNKYTETKKKSIPTIRQTKIPDILGTSTSKTSSSSTSQSSIHQNDCSVESNSNSIAKLLDIEQTSGKRVASSPVHAETKKPLVEFHISEDVWDDIDMDIDISNPLIKVLKSASVVKNSKIQVKQNKWICSGIVMSETKHEVEFSSEVLEHLIGVSPEEVLQLKNNPLNCSSLKEKIEKGIKGAHRKLHLFKGSITLTCSIDGNKKPIVTDMK